MPSFAIDIRSLSLILIAASVVEFLSMLFILMTRKTYAGFGLWTAGTAIFAAAFMLLVLRGFIPDIFAVVIANVLIMGAALLYYEGTLRFSGSVSRKIVSSIMLAAMALAIFYFRFVHDLMDARIIAASLLLAMVYGLVAWALLRHVPANQRSAYVLTGCCFAVHSFFFVARAFLVARNPGGYDVFSPGFVQTLTILIPLLLSFVWTFGFVMLNGGRLESELTSEILERRVAEEALKKSEEQVLLLLNSTAEAIYGIDLGGVCTFANPSCMEVLGYEDMGQLLGRNMHNLIHQTYLDGTPMPIEECQVYRAFRDGRGMHRDDEIFWKADGTSFPVEYWSYPQIAEGRVTGAVVTFIDITERKQSEEQIKHMATHDSLTDLPSLRLAQDRLSIALSVARRNREKAAVLFVDLDGFKAVNDTLGHEAGDHVLQQVAKRLQSCVRESDTVGRIGGDEFIIVLTGLHDPEHSTLVAEKVIKTISQPFAFEGKQAVIGASIGIAIYPDHTESQDQLIRMADESMYMVKNAGKNGYRFAKDIK